MNTIRTCSICGQDILEGLNPNIHMEMDIGGLGNKTILLRCSFHGVCGGCNSEIVYETQNEEAVKNIYCAVQGIINDVMWANDHNKPKEGE